ncbi:ArsR/SmtB family transcription factor [Pseudonocardia sp.]|uniref:ArsR/SmtB family transcription factor n=1 Tax=Pseudonocardia sp. TaxID=60912 RepID=UPI0039C9CCF5
MEALAALADPTRRHILELLRGGERSAGEIAEAFPVSRPAISRHLRVLRESGLTTVRVDGQRRVYALDPAPLAELDAWLRPYRQFWSRRLDALDALLDPETGLKSATGLEPDMGPPRPAGPGEEPE